MRLLVLTTLISCALAAPDGAHHGHHDHHAPQPAPDGGFQAPSPAPNSGYQVPSPVPNTGYQAPSPAPNSGYQSLLPPPSAPPPPPPPPAPDSSYHAPSNNLGGGSGRFAGGFEDSAANLGNDGGSSGGAGGYGGGAGRGCGPGEVLHVDGSCVVPVVSRSIYVYKAPDRPASYAPPPPIPKPKVNYNVVFVRTPEKPEGLKPIVVPPPQQKTLVYVLTKNGKLGQQVIEIPAGPNHSPEVFYLNYDEGDNPTLPGGISLKEALQSAVSQDGNVISEGGHGGSAHGGAISGGLKGTEGQGFGSNGIIGGAGGFSSGIGGGFGGGPSKGSSQLYGPPPPQKNSYQ